MVAVEVWPKDDRRETLWLPPRWRSEKSAHKQEQQRMKSHDAIQNGHHTPEAGMRTPRVKANNLLEITYRKHGFYSLNEKTQKSL